MRLIADSPVATLQDVKVTADGALSCYMQAPICLLETDQLQGLPSTLECEC